MLDCNKQQFLKTYTVKCKILVNKYYRTSGVKNTKEASERQPTISLSRNIYSYSLYLTSNAFDEYL